MSWNRLCAVFVLSGTLLACQAPLQTSFRTITNPEARFREFHVQMREPDFQQSYRQQALFQTRAASFQIQAQNQGFSLFYENFEDANAQFGSGSDWTEWGGDYYRDPSGEQAITLLNPQNHTQVLQSGFYKTLPLTAQAGDSLIAKMKVATTFTADSDTTLVLYFNDPNRSVLVSETARGPLAGNQTLMIQGVIPAGATEVTIAPLVYLDPEEQSSLLIDEISLEQIPNSYYQKRPLIYDDLDDHGRNVYGSQSPLGVDQEFGYDFYGVANWPIQHPGDEAVTVWNPGVGKHQSPEGGLVKRINLHPLQSGETLSARIYAATTFTDPSSFTLLSVQFFDAQDQLISRHESSVLRGNAYKWLVLDRISIPPQAQYAKIVPTVRLGANEQSSLLWDNLRVYTQIPAAEQRYFPVVADLLDDSKPFSGGFIGNSKGLPRPLGGIDADGFMSLDNGIDGVPLSVQVVETVTGPNYQIVNSQLTSPNTIPTLTEIKIEHPDANGSLVLQATPRYRFKSDGQIYDCLVHASSSGTGVWRLADPQQSFGGTGLADFIPGSNVVGSVYYARPVAKVYWQALQTP